MSVRLAQSPALAIRLQLIAVFAVAAEMCGTVCPSGAAQTDFPAISDQLAQIDLLARTYQAASTKSSRAPWLLLHDTSYGEELIAMVSRFGDGLPANLIPYKMHSVGRTGHDMLVGAVAAGFERIIVLVNPNRPDDMGCITEQFALASALLEGAGIKSEDRFRCLMTLTHNVFRIR